MASSSPQPARPAQSSGYGGWRWLTRPEFSLLLANIVVYLAVLYFDPQHNFKSSISLQLLITDTTLLTIFALGSTVVIIAGGIDLSVGSVIAFSGVVLTTVIRLLASKAAQTGAPVGMQVLIIAALAALAASLLVGVLHAVLITKLGLPPFVATLGTLIGLRSLGRVIAQHFFFSDKVAMAAPDFRSLWTDTWTLNLPGTGLAIPVRWVSFLVFLLTVVGVGILLRRTVVGRHLYAMGGNEEAARLSGIRTNRLKYLAYCIGSGLAGLAGILYAAQQGQGNSQTMGVGYELNAIAAAVVGGCSLRGGVGTVSGTLLGAMFLTLVVNGIPNLIKIDSSLYEGIIIGVVVILAVGVNQWRQSRGGRV